MGFNSGLKGLKYSSVFYLGILRKSTLYLIEVANHRVWDANPEILDYKV
jgi:hypothetical protein